jgi:hypothetical protein
MFFESMLPAESGADILIVCREGVTQGRLMGNNKGWRKRRGGGLAAWRTSKKVKTNSVIASMKLDLHVYYCALLLVE